MLTYIFPLLTSGKLSTISLKQCYVFQSPLMLFCCFREESGTLCEGLPWGKLSPQPCHPDHSWLHQRWAPDRASRHWGILVPKYRLWWWLTDSISLCFCFLKQWLLVNKTGIERHRHEIKQKPWIIRNHGIVKAMNEQNLWSTKNLIDSGRSS